MGGCGTSLDGRAIFEVTANYIQVHEYDWWVSHYIAAQQGVAEGRYTPEEADWSGLALYIKEADSVSLTPVSMVDWVSGGTRRVGWTYWDYREDGERPYTVEGKPLDFTFDPNGGLTRYTLTIVPRESYDDPIPESWNGALFFDDDCPLRASQLSSQTRRWIDSHMIDVGLCGDVLVTPYGEDPGVENPLASREIAVRHR